MCTDNYRWSFIQINDWIFSQTRFSFFVNLNLIFTDIYFQSFQKFDICLSFKRERILDNRFFTVLVKSGFFRWEIKEMKDEKFIIFPKCEFNFKYEKKEKSHNANIKTIENYFAIYSLILSTSVVNSSSFSSILKSFYQWVCQYNYP